MGYFLGVDLGTTYTAAAIARDGRVAITELGNRTPTVPSVVFLTDDEAILTGEAANRRAVTEPGRVAREFKRRIGDTTPLMLGGSPYSADALSAMLLRWVVETVTEREGSAPDGIAVAYPANWGPFKRDLLGQAIRQADLEGVATITEPEAAVVHYASQERVEPGSIIAVYDLGGGTFDSAIVRKTADGVEVMGEPEGIERLGGVDFDEAVFRHVAGALGDSLAELDPDDPVAMSAVARLRADCIEAKEALSSDTEVAIPVLLPNVQTEVRLTRTELEAMIRPPLANSMGAMRRAVRAAGISEDELSAVLLVGGSSRIPLVAQLVGSELGRPVAVDAHPKHAVALGTAQYAASRGGMSSAPPPAPASPPPTVEPPASPPPATVAPASADLTAAIPAPAPPVGAPPPAAPPPPTAPPPPAAEPPTPPPVPEPEPIRAAAPVPAGPPPPGYDNVTEGGSGGKGKVGAIVLGILVVLAVIAGAIALLGGGDDGDDGGVAADDGSTQGDGADEGDGGTADGGEDDAAPTTTTSTRTTTTTTTMPPACAGQTEPCIEIDAIRADGAALVVDWTAFNFTPNFAAEDHAHFYWGRFEAGQAGNDAASRGLEQVGWDATDELSNHSLGFAGMGERGDSTEVCVTVGTGGSHNVRNPDIFDCSKIPDGF